MNGTYQVLAYVDDVNLIADDIRTIERIADVLLNACKARYTPKPGWAKRCDAGPDKVMRC